MALTYTTLKQAIQDYTENDESTFVSQLDTFIQQAEERIYRSVTVPDLRKNVSGTVTSGVRFLSKPTDYLASFSIAVIDASGNYTFLIDKDVNFVREAYPSTSTQAQPKYYAEFDEDSFILGPTPDADYNVQLHYFYDPISITASPDGTSWLGTNAESALLYGSLVEAYVFMKGEGDVITMYEQRYQNAMEELSRLVDGRYKRDSYRDGEPRLEM